MFSCTVKEELLNQTHLCEQIPELSEFRFKDLICYFMENTRLVHTRNSTLDLLLFPIACQLCSKSLFVNLFSYIILNYLIGSEVNKVGSRNRDSQMNALNELIYSSSVF